VVLSCLWHHDRPRGVLKQWVWAQESFLDLLERGHGAGAARGRDGGGGHHCAGDAQSKYSPSSTVCVYAGITSNRVRSAGCPTLTRGGIDSFWNQSFGAQLLHDYSAVRPRLEQDHRGMARAPRHHCAHQASVGHGKGTTIASGPNGTWTLCWRRRCCPRPLVCVILDWHLIWAQLAFEGRFKKFVNYSRHSCRRDSCASTGGQHSGRFFY